MVFLLFSTVAVAVAVVAAAAAVGGRNLNVKGGHRDGVPVLTALGTGRSRRGRGVTELVDIFLVTCHGQESRLFLFHACVCWIRSRHY